LSLATKYSCYFILAGVNLHHLAREVGVCRPGIEQAEIVVVAVDAVNVVERLELFGLELVGLLQDSEKMGDGTKGIAREVEIFGR